MKKEDTQITLGSEQTEVEESPKKNYLEEYELINDTFQDDSPE